MSTRAKSKTANQPAPDAIEKQSESVDPSQATRQRTMRFSYAPTAFMWNAGGGTAATLRIGSRQNGS
jgi:hypothetical protein